MEQDLSKTAAEIPSAGKKHPGGARWKPIALAAALPAGLVILLWFVFREQLARAVPVVTAQVILLEQEGNTSAPTPGTSELLFQASGWVEPAPWSISLAVKTDGFIEGVYIREGETVTNGQIVARLDDTDSRLALAAAEADVRKHEALLNARISAADAAEKQVEAARFRAEASMARLARERDTSERYSKASPGVISHSERVAAEQAVIEYDSEEKAARSALTALEAHAVAAAAEIKVAEAALATAVQQRDMAKLALERTVIRSDMNGIVLKRFVEPGDKRMAGADDPHSAQIASIYNPEEVQVRVDVPIAEAGRLEVGQPARITTAMLPGRTLDGRVTRIIGQADLQRNTLQAKVLIIEPDPRLRPEVLCRVEFLSLPHSGRPGSTRSHTLWVPAKALASDRPEQEIWVIDPEEQTVSRRRIRLTESVRDGYRELAGGLRANETVVIEAKRTLQEGIRVKESIK